MTRSGGRTGVTPNSGSDVVINIRANILQAQDSIKRMNNTLKGFQNDSQAAWARVQKGVAGSQVEYMRLRMGASRALKDIAVGKQEVFNQTQKLNTALGRSPFPAWALSIMFFGMALQRTFNRIWQSSTRAFQEVMDSVDGTVTQFTVLQGTTKWLGFVVGQALEPIAGWLIPIIERVASWAEENEGLVRAIVLGLGVGGAAAIALGFMVTSIKGLADAWTSTKNGMLNTDWASFRAGLQKAIGVVSIAWSLKKLTDISESDNLIDALLNTFSAAAFAIGGVRAWRRQPGGGYFIAIGVALDAIENDTFVRSIGTVIAVLAAAFTFAWDHIRYNTKRALSLMTEDMLSYLRYAAIAIDIVFKTNVASKLTNAILGMNLEDRRKPASFTQHLANALQVTDGWASDWDSVINNAREMSRFPEINSGTTIYNITIDNEQLITPALPTLLLEELLQQVGASR